MSTHNWKKMELTAVLAVCQYHHPLPETVVAQKVIGARTCRGGTALSRARREKSTGNVLTKHTGRNAFTPATLCRQTQCHMHWAMAQFEAACHAKEGKMLFQTFSSGGPMGWCRILMVFPCVYPSANERAKSWPQNRKSERGVDDVRHHHTNKQTSTT